jgi:hypothetical protein
MSDWLGFFSTKPTPARSIESTISTTSNSCHPSWTTSDSRLTVSITPHISHCGDTLLLLAGYVYNHKSIRNSLRFASWRSDSVAETLVEGFAQKGLSLVLDLRGSFAFAVYDYRSGQLLLGRDRVGLQPLYLRWQDDGLFFSTQQSDLIQSRALTKSAVSQYLAFGHLSHASTLSSSDNVCLFCLPPGSAARINHSRSHDFIHYWPPQPRPEWTHLSFGNTLSVPSLLRQQLDLLICSQLDLVSHAVCLVNSDVESYCLASLVHHQRPQSFNSLSLVLPGERYHQFPGSNSGSYSLPHEIIAVSRDCALAVIESTLAGPNFLSLLNPLFFLRLHFAASYSPTSLFTSLGARELFSHLDICQILGIPGVLKTVPLPILLNSLRLFNIIKLPRRFLSSSSHFLSATVLLSDYPNILSLIDPSLPLPSLPQFFLQQLPDNIARMKWIVLRGILQPLSLPILSSTSSVPKPHVFAPFLDHTLVELALRTSLDVNRHHHNILLSACSDLFPKSIPCSFSQRTSSEFHGWMCGPLRSICLSRLDSLKCSGLFNEHWLQSQINSVKSGIFNTVLIWRLVLLGEYYQRQHH